MGLHRPIRGREAGGTIAARLAFGAWLAAGILLAVLWKVEPLHSQERIDPAEVSARTSPYVPPSQYRLRTEATLVEVGVVVRDRRGGTVGGLQKGDFEIRDDGRKRNAPSSPSTRLRLQADRRPGRSGQGSSGCCLMTSTRTSPS